MHVLSYNIHHGEGLDRKIDLERIAALVRESGADLVALQEVDRVTRRTHQVDQLGVLAAGTGFHPAFGKFMDFQGGEYGLGILSRYPIHRTWSIALPAGSREPRSALAVSVTHPTLGPTTFVCLHLDWLADDSHRFLQAQALVEGLRDVQGLVVLAGDFNDRPGPRTLELFGSRFTQADKPEDAHDTFPADGPDREIDFVMFRSATQIEASAIVLTEAVASDHRPILATLRQREGARP